MILKRIKSMRSGQKELILHPVFTSPHLTLFISLMGIRPLQQHWECKQRTLPWISSSPIVCLSIAHRLLRCNSRMSQLPAPASSPLLGDSAECSNYPRAGGCIAFYSMQSSQTTTWKSVHAMGYITESNMVVNEKMGELKTDVIIILRIQENELINRACTLRLNQPL